MIRIIGGYYKHRLINQPSLETTRCTKDIAKEGLFNSLGDISDLSFLDLFSGSGAVGIEAFSRGASHVVLNEKDKNAKRIIMSNLISLAINDIKVYGLDANDCIKELSSLNESFDIIFLDPPYKDVVLDNIEVNGIKAIKTDTFNYEITVIINFIVFLNFTHTNNHILLNIF